MKFLRFTFHRCTTAGGLRYRGTFRSGGHDCRIYSKYHPLSMTHEAMTFEGGMAVLATGGIRGGAYGHVVALWSDGKRIHFYSHNCGRRANT